MEMLCDLFDSYKKCLRKPKKIQNSEEGLTSPDAKYKATIFKTVWHWQAWIQNFSQQTCGWGSWGKKKRKDWKSFFRDLPGVTNTSSQASSFPVTQGKKLTKEVLNSGSWVCQRTGPRQQVKIGEFYESLLFTWWDIRPSPFPSLCPECKQPSTQCHISTEFWSRRLDDTSLVEKNDISWC